MVFAETSSFKAEQYRLKNAGFYYFIVHFCCDFSSNIGWGRNNVFWLVHIQFFVQTFIIFDHLMVSFLCFIEVKDDGRCKTNQCLRASANLLQSMDKSVDPCEDFYQFTCGNWAKHHPR